jgi:hypothetical protein
MAPNGTQPAAPPSRLALAARRQPHALAARRRRILALARAIRRAEPRIDDFAAFGPSVRLGLGPGRAVIFGDTAEIRFLAATDRSHFDYRLAWLGLPGDMAVIGGPASADFEAYQRELLGASGLAYLHVETDRPPLRRPAPVLCLKDEPTYVRLRAACAGEAHLTLLSHITTGTIWGLAARLAEDTGATLHVAGPPPLLARRVNDKLWFGSVVESLFGVAARPEKRGAHSLSALTRHLRELARDAEHLVLKVPDSAGSAGNLLIEVGPLRTVPHAAVAAELRRRLAGLAGPVPWPVAVEIWEANVLASPSVQLWLPRPEDGPPIVEGLYEQVLTGDAQTFVGAAPARLPSEIDARLSAEAFELALLFQALGYVGRLSFDAILAGPDLARARVQWIECNGRWGGVSIPMSLANRLATGGPMPAHVILQEPTPAGTPRPFAEVRRLAEETERATGARIVLLTPGPFERGSGLHLLALAESQEAALAAVRDFAARLA